MRAKKSLGQNFLKDKQIVKTMLSASSISQDELILEIGPGTGVLTQELLFTGNNVLAVEKDDRLIPILKEKFKTEIENGKLHLIHGDILAIDIDTILDKKDNYKIIANIPYYITGQIIKKFLTANQQPKSITLLLQKEVAHRIVSSDNKENILSLSVKVFGKPKYIKKVPARFFSPQPKVDSAIILINNISKNFFKKHNINERYFFEIIKQSFSSKRKKLTNNIKIDKNILLKTNLDINIRAEDLTLDDWGQLISSLRNNMS